MEGPDWEEEGEYKEVRHRYEAKQDLELKLVADRQPMEKLQKRDGVPVSSNSW